MLSTFICAAAIDTTHSDTARLIQQKENIITAATIIKVENMGAHINTPLTELRPTISADGNLLFFICENHPYNTNIILFATRRISGLLCVIVLVNGVKPCIWVIHLILITTMLYSGFHLIIIAYLSEMLLLMAIM